MENEIIRINEDTWRIEEDGVRFFLLTGSEKAVVIDCGMNTHNAREIAQSLTDLPLKLLCTHSDMDHLGSIDEFELPYMHPAEMAAFHKEGKKYDIIPVWDRDVLNLGGRELEIIELPGHTPGSIAILDRKYRTLFSGDAVQAGGIFMFGTFRNIYAYRHGLIRLNTMTDRFDRIYPSHGALPLDNSVIGELIRGAEDIIEGRAVFTDDEFFGTPLSVYNCGAASFLTERV